MADEAKQSIRNLIDSDSGPLRRFIGTLESTPEEPKSYGEGEQKRTSMQISLNFKDLEVIEAVEPYHFPIFTITLSESNRKKSKYGVFGVSLAEILDMQYTDDQKDPTSPNYVRPGDRMDLPDCIGKRIGMVLCDGEEGRPAKVDLFDGRAKDEAHPKGQDVPTAVWKCYMIEGIGSADGSAGVTPIEKAMQLLNGKTLAEFNKLAMQNDLIRSDVALLQSIGMAPSAANSFANTMVSSKQFTKSKEGVFTRVTG